MNRISFVFCVTVQGTSAAPKKTVRASESTSLSVGGLDSLPREDISGKITPTLLKSLESPDWKVLLSIYLIVFALHCSCVCCACGCMIDSLNKNLWCFIMFSIILGSFGVY